jgi:hypothetical protein
MKTESNLFPFVCRTLQNDEEVKKILKAKTAVIFFSRKLKNSTTKR